eukprot:474069-Prorocentrum_minimum.AAC.2
MPPPQSAPSRPTAPASARSYNRVARSAFARSANPLPKSNDRRQVSQGTAKIERPPPSQPTRGQNQTTAARSAFARSANTFGQYADATREKT